MLTLLQSTHQLQCSQDERRGGWYALIHIGEEAFSVALCDLCLSDLLNRWRLLGPMTAMNGVLLFGWSTAVIFEVLRRTMRSASSAKD